MSKTLLVIEAIRKIEVPFDVYMIIRRMGNEVSESTVRNALDTLPIMSAIRRKGKHFFSLYFPLDWTQEQVQAYLDKQTTTGKSKAKIYKNDPKTPQPTKEKVKKAKKERRVISHPMDYPKDFESTGQ